MKRPVGRPRRMRNYSMYDEGEERAQSTQYANPLSMRSPIFQIKSENTSNDEDNQANDSNGQNYHEAYET